MEPQAALFHGDVGPNLGQHVVLAVVRGLSPAIRLKGPNEMPSLVCAAGVILGAFLFVALGSSLHFRRGIDFAS